MSGILGALLGGGGGAPLSSATSGASAGSGSSSVGVSSRDLVWIAVAFAGALALIGIVWAILKD